MAGSFRCFLGSLDASLARHVPPGIPESHKQGTSNDSRHARPAHHDSLRPAGLD